MDTTTLELQKEEIFSDICECPFKFKERNQLCFVSDSIVVSKKQPEEHSCVVDFEGKCQFDIYAYKCKNFRYAKKQEV